MPLPMRHVSERFGKRPVVTPTEEWPTFQPERSADVSRIVWIVAALAIAAGLLYLYSHHGTHESRRVSASDAAAIERTIAGEDLAISPLHGIPNVSVDYYDIDATDTATIRAELNARGPIDEGRHFDANTRYYYHWNWDNGADGSCGTANADISFNAVIRLPHLTHFAALEPDVAQAWRAYMTALAFHEAGHVRNGYDGRDRVASAVRSASCADANAAGQEAIERLGEEDRGYDDRTRHGENDGAAFG